VGEQERQHVALRLLGKARLRLLLLVFLLLALRLEELGRVDVACPCSLLGAQPRTSSASSSSAGFASRFARGMYGEYGSIRFSSDRQVSMKFSTTSWPWRSM
jgi:hypothetical protein